MYVSDGDDSSISVDVRRGVAHKPHPLHVRTTLASGIEEKHHTPAGWRRNVSHVSASDWLVLQCHKPVKSRWAGLSFNILVKKYDRGLTSPRDIRRL